MPTPWESILGHTVPPVATRSKRDGSGVTVRGSIEALSTMNGPCGLMSRLAADPRREVFRWGR